MAPLLRVISQLAGGRLITLDHVHYARGSVLVFLVWTLTLDMNLPSLHVMLLSKIWVGLI